jgi:putative flippase GtrA
MKAPSRKTVKQFSIFNLGGVLFFVVGYGVFAVLYGLFQWSWLPAKIVGDGLGWLVNFVVQYFWAFSDERQGAKAHQIGGKFTAISVINLGIDYALVALLAWIGISPFIGLVVAANFFTLWKWLWYKHWVFKPKPSGQSQQKSAKPPLH